jgi:hypothetical protein
VGGALINATTGLMAHGGRNNDGWTSMAGITMNAMASQGWTTRLIYNMASLQETTLDYSANTAEVPTGGVRINIIPREGGNTFNGTFFGSFANASMQGNNVSDELRQRGLRTPDAVKELKEVNPGFGGPLRRDKVWFYVSALYTGSLLDVANMWFNKNANNPNAWTFDPDLSRPAYKDTHYQGGDFRLTWQVSQRNKIGFMYADQSGCTCVGVVSATIAPEADIREEFPIQRRQIIDWTSPVTSRMLLEAGFAKHYGRSIRVPGLDTSPAMISVVEQSTGLRYRANDNFRNGPNESANFRFSTSYITGAHAYKAGVTHTNGYEARDTNDGGQPLTYRFNNGIPNQLTERALPVFSRIDVPHNFGIFAQDKWTIRRFTASYGARYDWFVSNYPDQTLGPTVFTPNRNVFYPAADNINWKDLSPRMGAIYDLFGTGKTAVKVSLNKYLQNEAAGSVLAIGPNPLETVVRSASRSWNDTNRNYVPDCELTSPVANGECGAMSNQAFGRVVQSATYDPELLRGWGRRFQNWEFSAGVQHELLPRTSLDVAYFRRAYGNFAATDNLALASSDFDTFRFSAPADSRLPDGGGQVISGLYDLKPAVFGRPANNFVTRSQDFGDQTERWHGVDIGVSMRAQNGLLVQGGVSSGSTLYDTCEIQAKLPELAPTNPYCRYETAFLTNVKGLASYTLPRIDVLLSGTFRSVPGTEILANYAVPNALVQPSLGRPLSGNQANVTVNLVEPGSLYSERYDQLDIRVGKILRFGRTKTTVSLDVYNVFNGNNVLTMNNTFGPAWQQPQSIMLARFVKISGQFDF